MLQTPRGSLGGVQNALGVPRGVQGITVYLCSRGPEIVGFPYFTMPMQGSFDFEFENARNILSKHLTDFSTHHTICKFSFTFFDRKKGLSGDLFWKLLVQKKGNSPSLLSHCGNTHAQNAQKN